MKELDKFLEEKKEDKSKAHQVKEGEGADDKEYVLTMEKYKRERRRLPREEANKILDKAKKLKKEGDVSKRARIAGAYI